MNAPAAFRACYSDWKLIRTRKVVQIVLEVPIEEADAAYQVLGGMPNPAESFWCAVARLKPDAPEKKTKREWHELPPAQQAGIRCNEPAFAAFLRECWPTAWVQYGDPAAVVRHICRVQSRSQIKPDNPESVRAWQALNNAYQFWQHEPEVA
jgi:hypothetical protein